MAAPTIEEALVLGCGVSGLTVGVRLAEAGFPTRIVAREIPPHTTSDRAAAIWYPYLAEPRDRVVRWGRRTLDVLEVLARVPDAGVRRVELLEVFTERQPDPWWRRAVTEFRRARPDELPAGRVDGWLVSVPMIEVPVYLPYLHRRFEAAGGWVERAAVERLADVEGEDRLVVNCTGLGAAELCDDGELFPIRGQVVRVAAECERAWLDGRNAEELTHIFPRSGDCVLGGTAEVGSWDREVDPATTDAILRRAARLQPGLEGAEVLEAMVGLRPGRSEVRLELEERPDGPVIHDYGHGGAGFTLSWGCADEVLELARGVARRALAR